MEGATAPIAVSCTDPARSKEAAALAERLGLPLAGPKTDAALLLTLAASHLELRRNGGSEGPVWVDFTSGAADYRRRQSGRRTEAIARASRRVVVKRPRLAPSLAGPIPDFALIGTNSRFDVYLRSGSEQ